MPLNIAIVDDMADDREAIAGCIDSFFSYASIQPETTDTKLHGQTDVSANGAASLGQLDKFETGAALLESYFPGFYAIIFLDIQMGEMDGIELAGRLRALDPHVIIIFQTSSREYAFDAFPVHPFDYIVKPYEEAQIHRVLTDAIAALTDAEIEISVRVAYGDVSVPVSRIISAVSEGHVVNITMDGAESLQARNTFSEIQELLEKNENFLVCNRGVIINMDHATGINNDCICMKNGSSYPIRIREKNVIAHRFTSYQIAKMKERMHP